MPSTRNLLASSLYVLPLLNYQPIQIGGEDPALTAANLTKQIMLGPPFRWPWNRAVTTFTCVIGQQDYPLTVTDLGWIERISITDPGSHRQIEVKNELSLAPDGSKQRPASGGIYTEAADGTKVFRFNTSADQAYPAAITYQRRAVPMTSLAATWAPIPDEQSYIYDAGYLAHLSALTRDSRMPIFRSQFAAHLLGVQDGLDATSRNIFLGNFIDAQLAQQRILGSAQQGASARSQ